MPSFAIRHPYLIIVFCLVVVVLGVTSMAQMPVDMFPPINIPVVLVATFYNGMPPQQIEADITDTFERFFTLAGGVDHMESRSLTGVSLIKIYFQPGSDANADVTQISNLAMADLRRLAEGTLPPVVLKVDASSLPVCLLTVQGQGLDETQLHDYLQYQIRNQIAGVPGATVPPPFGGKYRALMVYVDPLKLQAHELSPMDIVRATNSSNFILPAGDVRMGPLDYNIYTNAQVPSAQALNDLPVRPKTRDPFLSPMLAMQWTARRCSTTSFASMAKNPSMSGFRSRGETRTRSPWSTASEKRSRTFAISPRSSRPASFSINPCLLRKHLHGAAGRRHRNFSHGNHDSGLSGQFQGHRSCVPVHSLSVMITFFVLHPWASPSTPWC